MFSQARVSVGAVRRATAADAEGIARLFPSLPPLASTSEFDSRSFFTESKVPFKNSTNNDINMACYSEIKRTTNIKFSRVNEEESMFKSKDEKGGRVDREMSKAVGGRGYGDRFIPCRFGNNTYENRY